MGLNEFDTIKKFSSTLKIGLSCDVTSEEMISLQKLNVLKGVSFEIAKDQHPYDVMIGRGKIVATTIYKMNLDQLSIEKILDVCNTISQSYVWSVIVMQTIKPNAWYEKAIGRNMFVYRDNNDFLTEPMSGKKVWELDVRNCESKYSHDVELVKKIDLTSTEALIDVITRMAQFGTFSMSFALTIKCYFKDKEKSQTFYTKDLKLAWAIAEKLRSSRGSEMAVIELIDEADSSALNFSDYNDAFLEETSGKYFFSGDISMRMLSNYETATFKGDIQFGLNSYTDGKMDDFSYQTNSIAKTDSLLMSKHFDDLVELAKIYPKQILQNCWLEAAKQIKLS